MLYEDALVFSYSSGASALFGVSGDILEIGAFNGKSAAVLALRLHDGERLHVCDLFDVQILEQMTPTSVMLVKQKFEITF